MVTAQQTPPASLSRIMAVTHRVRVLTTKIERKLTQATATTIRSYVVEEGFLTRRGEPSIIREGGGSFLHLIVEDADAEDLGDGGGEVPGDHMLLYHRDVAIQFVGSYEGVCWFVAIYVTYY